MRGAPCRTVAPPGGNTSEGKWPPSEHSKKVKTTNSQIKFIYMNRRNSMFSFIYRVTFSTITTFYGRIKIFLFPSSCLSLCPVQQQPKPPPQIQVESKKMCENTYMDRHHKLQTEPA